MNAIMDTAKDILAKVLGFIYPDVPFDTEGLVRMLVPCALVLAAALILYLLLKCFYGTRRFAHTVLTAALIVLISASAFFPEKLAQAGDYAAGWLQERFWAEKEQTPEGEEAPETEDGQDSHRFYVGR